MSPVFPPELFFSIVAQIGDLESSGTPSLSDISRLALSNLRMVNKAVNDFATPYLFHTITTWLIQDQFERLQLISSKEYLRHHVYKIVFRPWEIRTIATGTYLNEIWCCDVRTRNRLMPADLTFANFDKYVQNFSILPLTCQIRLGHGVNGTVSPLLQMWSPPTYTENFLRQGEQEYLRAHHIQSHRRMSGIDMAQLKDVFVKFDDLSHITIAPGEAYPENNSFLELTGIAPHPYWFRNGTYLIRLVIASLKNAKIKIRHLEIDTGRNQDHSWDETAFDIFLHGPNHDYLYPFTGLEKLCITDLGRYVTNPAVHASRFSAYRPITKLLEASPLLNELTLGLHRNWKNLYDINFMILSTLKFVYLRQLTLHGFLANEQVLADILKAHKLSLRTLNLHNMTMSVGTWASLADTIRCTLKLTDANLAVLSIQRQILGANNTVVASTPLQRTCFAFHRDRTLAGSLDDYIARKIDHNPMTKAIDTGYIFEQDDWPAGTPASEGWKPGVHFLCGCNRHRGIPDF
ncbi:hypothetical protein MMC26_007328 [Xylographa opegraphella]|nr:hypothetical protein [Xylographa opegraphella]